MYLPFLAMHIACRDDPYPRHAVAQREGNVQWRATSPIGEWLDAGSACALPTLAMRIHVRSQQRIHSRLVTATLGAEPFDNV
jgi:hypothetical protein